jgi:hypothetical protein
MNDEERGATSWRFSGNPQAKFVTRDKQSRSLHVSLGDKPRG